MVHYFSSEVPLCNLPTSILSSYQEQNDPVKMQDSLSVPLLKPLVVYQASQWLSILTLSPPLPSYSSFSQWLPSSQWLPLFIMSSNAWITCLLLCLSHHLSFCSPYFLHFILVSLASHWPCQTCFSFKDFAFFSAWNSIPLPPSKLY